jgi:hypothetical protein
VTPITHDTQGFSIRGLGNPAGAFLVHERTNHMTRPQALATAKRIAALAKDRRNDVALSARIENAGIEFLTAAKTGDPKVEPPRWLNAMLNETRNEEVQ